MVISGALGTIGERIYKSETEAQTTPQNVEARVREWLDSFKIGSQREDDPNAHFVIIAAVNGQRIAVIRPRQNDRYLQLRGGVFVSEEHGAALAKLPKSAAESVTRELVVEMARFKIAFTAIGMPVREINLFRVVPIYAGLTEGEFIKALDEVDSAALLVKASFVQSLERQIRLQSCETVALTPRK